MTAPDDLIRRIDAIQACQVGSSDGWAFATKSGYNQAALDCARNILQVKPSRTLTPTPVDVSPAPQTDGNALAEALKLPEVAAIMDATRRVMLRHDLQNLMREADFHPEMCQCDRCEFDNMRAALKAVE